MGYFTKSWTWYSGWDGEGVFIIRDWAVYVSRERIEIGSEGFDNDLNQGWIKEATPSEIESLCRILYQDKKALEVLFGLIFDPPPFVVGQVLYQKGGGH